MNIKMANNYLCNVSVSCYDTCDQLDTWLSSRSTSDEDWFMRDAVTKYRRACE